MNDYFLNSLNKIVNVASGLAVSVVLARYLGVELRGELAFVMQLAAVAAIVVGLGVNQAFIVEYRKNPVDRTFARASGLLMCQVVAFALVAILPAIVLHDLQIAYIAALTACLALYQQFESIMAAYNIRLKIRVNVVYAVARLLAHLVMWPLAAVSLLWPVLIAMLTCLGAVALYVFANSPQTRPRRPDAQTARLYLGFGWLPMLTTLLVVLNYSVDIILLKTLGTPTDLGLYAVAAGIVTYLWVLPDAIKEVLVSRVVRSDDPWTVLRPLKAALMAGLISVGGLAIVGYPVIPLLFGADFAGAYVLVMILSAGVVAMIYYKVLGVAVLAGGRRAFYFGALATAVVLNVALNWLVIPTYGAVGAAWASVVTYTVTGLLFVAYFGRVSEIPLRRLVLVGKQDVTELWNLLRRPK